MQLQRELQGQLQRKKVERRYRERCNKGPKRDCLHVSFHPFKGRVQTGGAERVSDRGIRGGAQRDAER